VQQQKWLLAVPFLRGQMVLLNGAKPVDGCADMRPSRGMGDISPSKMPKSKTIRRKDNPNDVQMFAEGGESKVNEAGNYTKPSLRKRIFNSVKAAAIVGTGAGEWSARKAQVMAKRYKAEGGGYTD